MGQWGRKDQQGAFGWAEAVCFDIGVPRLLESGQMSLLEQLAWNGDLHGCKPDSEFSFLNSSVPVICLILSPGRKSSREEWQDQF